MTVSHEIGHVRKFLRGIQPQSSLKVFPSFWSVASWHSEITLPASLLTPQRSHVPFKGTLHRGKCNSAACRPRKHLHNEWRGGGFDGESSVLCDIEKVLKLGKGCKINS